MKANEILAPFSGKSERPMQIVMSWLGILRRIGQKAGPYLMLEMLLPGGTLFALLLFLWQRRKPATRRGGQRPALDVMRALADALEQRTLVPAPIRVTNRVSYPQCSTTIRSER
jgi:hypothetical protein